MRNISKLYHILIGILIGVIISIPTFGFASNPIKLFLNGEQIKTDVPPQIINSRLLVPVRAITEALGAKVEWDPNTNAVNVTLKEYYDTSIVSKMKSKEFKNGVTVEIDDSLFTVYVDRTQLPDNMKHFTKLSVLGIQDLSERALAAAFDNIGYMEAYNEKEGWCSANPDRYNLVTLHDDKGNLLGYYILEK